MNRITIDTEKGTETISRHIYGHFAEHLGRCIYDGIWVGEGSDIPNVRGIRTDIVEALKAIKIPNLRWPGGCFADDYHWMDGIGPREERPCIVNTNWGGVTENNHFGTHEFMDLCEQLGCEPYICGNMGSGTVREMSQWIEYLTHPGPSPMAKLRAENGHPDPWKVRFWGVGNENWGCGGHMTPEYYINEFRRYSTYCRDYAPNELYRVACGPSGGNAAWTEACVKGVSPGAKMAALGLHYYVYGRADGSKSRAVAFDETEWFTTMKHALRMDELVKKNLAVMDQYEAGRKADLLVDEWGTWHLVEAGTPTRFLYQQNTLRDALVAGLTLNIFNNHCDRVKMANIAQTVNVLQAMILTEREKMLLTPTYHVFDMYKVHQDATLLPVTCDCSDYSCGDESIPAISVSASRDAAGRVHITLCNLHPQEDMEVSCDWQGAAPGEITGRILTADRMNAHNTFDQVDAVRPEAFTGATQSADGLSVQLPARSVVVISISQLR